MLCSLIWLFTYSGSPHRHTHTHRHVHWGKQNSQRLCGILSLVLAQIQVQVVVVAAVELVGFHVVFRYNFFLVLFFIFSLCWNKYMYLTRAPAKKVVVDAEVLVLPFANSVSKHQPLFQKKG